MKKIREIEKCGWIYDEMKAKQEKIYWIHSTHINYVETVLFSIQIQIFLTLFATTLFIHNTLSTQFSSNTKWQALIITLWKCREAEENKYSVHTSKA